MLLLFYQRDSHDLSPVHTTSPSDGARNFDWGAALEDLGLSAEPPKVFFKLAYCGTNLKAKLEIKLQNKEAYLTPR